MHCGICFKGLKLDFCRTWGESRRARGSTVHLYSGWPSQPPIRGRGGCVSMPTAVLLRLWGRSYPRPLELQSWGPGGYGGLGNDVFQSSSKKPNGQPGLQATGLEPQLHSNRNLQGHVKKLFTALGRSWFETAHSGPCKYPGPPTQAEEILGSRDRREKGPWEAPSHPRGLCTPTILDLGF